MNWIHLACNRDQWQVLNDQGNNFGFLLQGVFRLPEEMLVFQEGLCSI